MTTGERIKALRLKYGYTQEELAALVGVQKAAINKYEDGTVVNLKQSVIAALSKALHVRPSYLLGYDDEQPAIDPAAARLQEIYRQLSPEGRRLLLQTAESFALNPAFRQDGTSVTA